MKVLGVIPARYGSTRLPGKPLAMIGGKTMIQHVYERAKQAKILESVVIATDDGRILKECLKFGAECVLTSAKHKSGTSRVKEAASVYPCKYIVNIQGDEPFIHPSNIDKIVEALIKSKADVSTLAVKITRKEALDPNKVKVVFDCNMNAMYFSRSVIPYGKGECCFKHIGIYAYTATFLKKLDTLKPSRLEKEEMLEQLRFLENGFTIKVASTKKDSLSVDTLKDLKKARGKARTI